ncbi:MAG: ankyrin repeat domain-containing protein [Planctomycetota bacterium]|jgi:ankyrin repeat protein
MRKVLLLTTLVGLLPVGLFAQQGDNNQQKTLVFTHVTVIDATGAPAQPDMTVVIKGDRIEALDKTDKLTIPRNSQVVDATGKFLIPGLWDMHTHPWISKRYFALLTANGVTGIRVMWGKPEHHAWREEISAGELIGPRMVIASPVIDGPGDPRGHGFTIVRNEEEGQQIVRKSKAEGADLIKVYNNLSRDTYFAIVDESKKQGIPFAGHVPVSVSAAEASDAGQQSIEHTRSIMMPCSTSGEKEILRRFSEVLPGENWLHSIEKWRSMVKIMRDINYDERKAAELFSRFVKNNTWACPTLIVWHGLMFYDEHLANDPRLKYMPLYYRNPLNLKKNAYVALATGEWRAEFRELCEKHLAIVGAMRNAGVGLLAGTDATGIYCIPGFGLHDELALFVQAGLSPMEALQTATYNAAKCLGLLDSMGTVEQGKIADLVLLDANPLQDIRNTRRITTVVVGGRVFDKTALQKMLIQVEASYFHKAVGNGNIEHVNLLISEGADVNVKSNYNQTPLQYAAREGHKEIVELLLAHGADVNFVGAAWDKTAAGHAMRSNHTEIVQLLISKGADISPLHFALYMKDEAKARSLIEGGADVNRRTPNGTTPLNRAIGNGLKDIAELLIARGADVNAGNSWGWTSLHGAADEGYKDIVELLIAKGANVNARDSDDRTPLWHAKDEGNSEIVELLRKHGAKE